MGTILGKPRRDGSHWREVKWQPSCQTRRMREQAMQSKAAIGRAGQIFADGFA
jgi:hypothetical protein